MRTIRQNVFETNSSSSHSVTISSEGRNSNLKNLKRWLNDDKLVIQRGEFGWDIAEHTDFATKLSYAYTLAARNEWFWSGRPKLSETLDPEEGDDQFKMLEEVLRDHFGDIEIVYENNEGYVDHQSHDMASEIFESKETLADFLFSPFSVLNTDNDNH